MSTDKQADRPLTVDTPLGTDKMLLRGLHGKEAISQLFRFELDLLADNKLDVQFDQLLGKAEAVEGTDGRRLAPVRGRPERSGRSAEAREIPEGRSRLRSPRRSSTPPAAPC